MGHFLSKNMNKLKKYGRIHKSKIEKLHNLANFGKLSAGILHDLISPLNALMLNLEQAISINKQRELKNYLNQANTASLNLKNILISAKNQINYKDEKSYFIINKEIKNILLILNYQINEAKISIKIEDSNNVKIFGSKIKFNRIITNLLINAIEACKKMKRGKQRICISITKSKKEVIIKIIDNGCGIPKSLKNDLFQAFVSKKNSLGLGLYLVRKIVEEDFKGKIVNQNINNNTIFKIKLNC